MTTHNVASLKDCDIARDGRNVILNFNCSDQSDPLSLKLGTMELEKIAHELAFVIIRARAMSEVAKQGVVPFMRPRLSRADLTTDGLTVVVSFALPSGMVTHYGLESTDADSLARQIQDASEKSKKTSRPSQH